MGTPSHYESDEYKEAEIWEIGTIASAAILVAVAFMILLIKAGW